jgi:hypothetical protein
LIAPNAYLRWAFFCVNWVLGILDFVSIDFGLFWIL